MIKEKSTMNVRLFLAALLLFPAAAHAQGTGGGGKGPATPLALSGATIPGGQASTVIATGGCRYGCSLQDISVNGFWVNDTGASATNDAPSEWVPPGSQWSPAAGSTTFAVSVWPVATGKIAGRYGW